MHIRCTPDMNRISPDEELLHSSCQKLDVSLSTLQMRDDNMTASISTRNSRKFPPSLDGFFKLESRLLLDASAIPGEVQAAMDAKTQLKDDMI